MDDLRATSGRLQELGLVRTTLLIDERRARANIDRFVARARASGSVLRPHFKTHQSATVGEWFREAGVTRATVGSLGQAVYFADHGWDDILLAMGANPLEVADYSALAARVRLGLLTDNAATIAAIGAGLSRPVNLWLDVDVGYGRTGVDWSDTETLGALARAAEAAPTLQLAGLLTHAGHSYNDQDAADVFASSRHRLTACRDALAASGIGPLRISAGDTPGFAAVDLWTGLDDARPGNFVFFDLMQLVAGACTAGDLACAVASPVIGVYPDRNQMVIHGGAVHLSREHLTEEQGASFGRLLTLGPGGFSDLLEDWSLVSLSQEHGVLEARGERARSEVQSLQPGDLVLIAPVHSCLTCEQFASYRTLDGTRIQRYRRD